MDIEQVKWDFENGVLIGRETMRKVISFAMGQAAIAQPGELLMNWFGGRCESCNQEWRSTKFDSCPICHPQPSGAIEKAASRFLRCVNENKAVELVIDTAEAHTEFDRARRELQVALAAAPQPPASIGIGHWHDGSKPVDWTPEAEDELHAVLAEYPPESSTGSIGDDERFLTLFDDYVALVKKGEPADISQRINERRELFAYITRWADARTVAASAKDAAARDVLAERKRQVEVERRTPARDDIYMKYELRAAAVCYALTYNMTNPENLPALWPLAWAPEWWKPSTERRNLVKAGALILAEIERLDRAAIATTKAAT